MTELNSTNGHTGQQPPEPAEDEPRAVPGRRGLSDSQKRILAVAVLVHVVMATMTFRDLRHRPVVAVRGPGWLWRLWAMANTSGSVAYWLFGRRRLS